MREDEHLGLAEVVSAVAPAQEHMGELSRTLRGLGAYVCALVPSGRAMGRESITAVTPGGESMTITIAMVEALAGSDPVLAGMYPVDVRLPSKDVQVEFWPSEAAPIHELELTLHLRSGRGMLSEPIKITAPWGLSPRHTDLVLVCGEKPEGWPR